MGEGGGNGTYHLQGGVLITPSIIRGSTGTAAFNGAGGRLHVDTFGSAATAFNLLQQGGVLAPGRSIGSTTIYGNYTQTTDGVLEIEIASPTSYDTVTVYGSAELHGQILVSLLGGYVPSVGQRFPILSTTGSLDISGLTVGNLQPAPIGWVLELAAGQGGGQVLLLQAVPEPASWSLALLGLVGLGIVLAVRRRQQNGA
ncbi:MAG: PEP-CTERM sorting domain-containing protein [Thermoguttaceae bacterium]|nr:PEP-CTERM sorting domain-containing protein [Thermoguttaceae bacterium]MDW8036935.1 PEP-CTERM sorting domain-containing protein [Thermoguttaceae bacterium]